MVGAPHGRIGGPDPETGTREESPSDTSAKCSVEWFDGIAFGDGDVGRVFRISAATGGDQRREKSRSDALTSEGWSHAKGE